MLKLLPETKGANIAVKASGIIRKSDYETFLPEFEQLCQEVLQFRLLLDWEHLEGWDEEALEISFAERFMHRYRCERLAIIANDSRWENHIDLLRELLIRKDVRVFSPAERDAAWSWLTQD